MKCLTAIFNVIDSDGGGLISETIENFDPDNLTREQAIEIVKNFSAAGFNLGKELADILVESGFDVCEIGSMARVSIAFSETISASTKTNLVDLVNYLDVSLEQIGGEPLNDGDKQGVYDSLHERFGLAGDESIISITAL